MYNYKPDFSWDTEPFTQRQIVEILQELVLFHSDSSPAFSMYIHVHEKLLLSYISALEEAGFKWTIFTWVKGEAVKVKHQSYGRSTELILVCSIGDLPRSYTVNMPATPAARANVAFCNSVPDGAMLTNAQNQVINGAQKPTCIAQMFAHDLTQGGPNSTVLVLGGGSGSEVVGALQNGNSVVVFEKDQVQFRAMQARLEQALGVHTTVLTVIPPDQQPKTLLVEPAEYAWQRGRIRHFDRSLSENSEAEFSSARKAFRALTRKSSRSHQSLLAMCVGRILGRVKCFVVSGVMRGPMKSVRMGMGNTVMLAVKWWRQRSSQRCALRMMRVHKHRILHRAYLSRSLL